MKLNHWPLLCALLLFVANLFNMAAVYRWKAKHTLLESQFEEYRRRTDEHEGRLVKQLGESFKITEDHKLWFCRGAIAGVVVWEQEIKHNITNRANVCDLICEAAWEPYADIKTEQHR